MSNSFFKYKQFTVHQDKCAMKVCTDSSLFGALIPSENAQNILDIGTGTGLLSLMQAQKSNAQITALEIDQKAAAQAFENFENSPWENRFDIQNTDAKKYFTSVKFDLILSNPPFFKENFKSNNQQVNLARHDDGLTLSQLFTIVTQHLSEDGRFWVLLPEYEFNVFEKIATKTLFCYHKYLVSNTKGKTKLRVIGGFSRKFNPIQQEEIVIKTPENTYTSQFKDLLKDYYLAF